MSHDMVALRASIPLKNDTSATRAGLLWLLLVARVLFALLGLNPVVDLSHEFNIRLRNINAVLS